jgi:hypothetical protein
MTNQKHEILHIEEGKLTPQRIESAIRRLPVQTQQRMDGIQAMVAIDEVSRSIAECTTIELGKYLDNKIDALAALAKILKDDKLTVAAKRAKLENYRKLGELAESLRPKSNWEKSGPVKKEYRQRYEKRLNGESVETKPRGRQKGASSLLQEHGFSPTDTALILNVKKIPEKEFSRITSLPIPPSVRVAGISGVGVGKSSWSKEKISSDSYRIFGGGVSGVSVFSFKYFCRKYEATDLARGLTPDEAVKAREVVIEIQEWLDTFERHLPKEAK